MSNIPVVEGAQLTLTPRPAIRPEVPGTPFVSPAPGAGNRAFNVDATSPEDVKANNEILNSALRHLMNKVEQIETYTDALVKHLEQEFPLLASKTSMMAFEKAVKAEFLLHKSVDSDIQTLVDNNSFALADLRDTMTRFQLCYPISDDLVPEPYDKTAHDSSDTTASGGDAAVISPAPPPLPKPKVTFEVKNPYDVLDTADEDSDSSLNSDPHTSCMPGGLLTSSDDDGLTSTRKKKLDLPFSSIKPPALPTFDGNRDPITWFTEVENILDSIGGSELNYHRAISKVVLGFKGDAAMWWRDYKRGHPVRSLTWQRFKKALCSYFKTLDREDAALIKLYSLQQKGSVQQYVTYIKKIILDLPDVTDKDLYIRFKFGLREALRVELMKEEARRRTNFIPLKDAFKFCSMIERAERRTDLVNKAFKASSDATRPYKPPQSGSSHGGGGGSGSGSGSGGGSSSTSAPQSGKTSSNTSSKPDKVICNKCQRPGHYAKACDSKWHKDGKPICAICKQVGHLTRECPTASDKGKKPSK